MIQARGQTFVQKLLTTRVGRAVVPGEVVEIAPDLVSSHDDTALVAELFAATGAAEVYDPDLHVIVLGCASTTETRPRATAQRTIRSFAERHGIERFYDVDAGLCHQVLMEQGFVRPGRLIVGSDPHTVGLGALGAFATRVEPREIAAVMATGKVRLRVPETLRVEVTGALPAGVAPQDLALKIGAELGTDGAAERSVEFLGSTITDMSLGGRVVLCSMIATTGASNAFIAPAEITYAYLNGRARDNFEVVCGDPKAPAQGDLSFDASRLEPQIACPDLSAGSATGVVPCAELAGTPVDQVVIGGGTGGRREDLQRAAAILAGRKVHPGTRCLILPASNEVLRAVVADGTLLSLLDAGAVLASPACNPCRRSPQGVLAPGEVGLSSADDRARESAGEESATVYIGSPASCAAAAIAGEIIDPREMIGEMIREKFSKAAGATARAES